MALLIRATIRPVFGVHVHFFMKNEIMSEDIKKCQNILFFTFLILHGYISGVTKSLYHIGKLR